MRTYFALDFDYITNTTMTEARILKVAVAPLQNPNKIEVFDGIQALRDLLYHLAYVGADYVYVFDGSCFMPFLDAYALEQGLPYYDELKDDTGKRKHITTEAWCASDGDGVCYTRKFWILSKTQKNRHKRLHAITFLNFAPLVGNLTRIEAVKAFTSFNVIDGDLETIERRICQSAEIISAYNDYYAHITGVPLLGNRPHSWTIGGAARSFYLALKYPDLSAAARLKAYQKTHPMTEQAELHYRNGRLLLGGMLYINPQIKGKLITGRIIRKYDRNSLYPYTSAKAGELGTIRSSSLEEYNEDESGEYIYILSLSRLTLSVKQNRPAVFSDPFSDEATGQEFINITQKYYIFGHLLEALQSFYDIVDIQINAVFKARKIEDKAMKRFVCALDEMKVRARASGNDGAATTAKLFTNNLQGKFSQHTYYENRNYKLVGDIVTVEAAAGIKNDWLYNHFDYVRGAYIYVTARVNMLNDLAELCDIYADMAEHLYYIDTDCFVTDKDLPPDWLDPLKLGKYKIEAEYTALQILAAKTYWGRTLTGDIDLKVAGINKDYLKQQIQKRLGKNFSSDKQIAATLSDNGLTWQTRILTRVKGGAVRIPTVRALIADGLTDGDEYRDL